MIPKWIIESIEMACQRIIHHHDQEPKAYGNLNTVLINFIHIDFNLLDFFFLVLKIFFLLIMSFVFLFFYFSLV